MDRERDHIPDLIEKDPTPQGWRKRFANFLRRWAEFFDPPPAVPVKEPALVKITSPAKVHSRISDYEVVTHGQSLVVYCRSFTVVIKPFERNVQVFGSAPIRLESRTFLSGDLYESWEETTEPVSTPIFRDDSENTQLRWRIENDPVIGGRNIKVEGCEVLISSKNRRVIAINMTVSGQLQRGMHTWGYGKPLPRKVGKKRGLHKVNQSQPFESFPVTKH